MGTAARSRIAAAFGLAATAWALLVPVLGSCATDAYSHVGQYISELGASGVPNGSLVSLGGFAATGVLVLVFLFSARPLLPRSKFATGGVALVSLVGVAYLVTGVFPCDPGCPAEGSISQSIHNSFGLLEYLGAITGFGLLAVAFGREAGWRVHGVLSAIAAILVVLGLAGMLTPALGPERGLSQRLAEAAIFAWIACTSARLLGIPDAFIGSHVRLVYDDQNESFASYLPIEGKVSRRCTATGGSADWYLVDLSRPIDYQHQVGPHDQFKRLIVPRVLIHSRWPDEPLGSDTEPSVFLLLVADDQDVPRSALSVDSYLHVCWARCQALHAA